MLCGTNEGGQVNLRGLGEMGKKKSVEKYRKVSKNVEKVRKKCKKVSKSIEKCRKVSKNCEKLALFEYKNRSLRHEEKKSGVGGQGQNSEENNSREEA